MILGVQILRCRFGRIQFNSYREEGEGKTEASRTRSPGMSQCKNEAGKRNQWRKNEKEQSQRNTWDNDLGMKAKGLNAPHLSHDLGGD